MEMRFKSYAMLVSATMLLASCAGEDPWREEGGGKGTIVLNLTASGSLDNLTSQGRADLTADIPNFPTVDQFSIRLTPVGGVPVEYKTIAEFEENMEAGVKAGAYTIEAYYGDPLDQGDKPYVYGVQNIRVNEQTVSTVDLTAKLANSLVEVTYTEAFKSYFTNYSTTLKSDKNSESVTITGVDGASKYVTPGFINVTMAATYLNGKDAHLNPKNFSAEAAYLYRVKYDVNAGQVGNPTLSITFDDNIDEVETVEVDLSNDFFSAAPPEVTAEGFTPGEPVSARFASYDGEKLRFNIVAEGKIAEAILSITSTGTDLPYAPSFGSSVNLVNADQTLQSQLNAEGVTALGVFNNPDKIAMVDVTGLINRLPEGTHEISLIVKDAKTRVSEPVTLTFVTIPVGLRVTSTSEKPYDKEEAEINLYYDGGDLSKISFMTRDERGMEVACVAGSPVNKGDNNYTYTLRLPVDRRAIQPVTVCYGGKAKETVEVKVAWPEVAFTYDAFATWARVKVDGFSADFLDLAMENGWLEIKTDKLIYPTYDAANKWLVYEGLNPATEYSILVRDGVYSMPFTTESATNVPNGDFSQVHETINIGSINTGGTYTCSTIYTKTYQNTSSIRVNEPLNWASVNSKTCYLNSNSLNTWFVVPSTYVANDEVVIRNVAYDHNGTLPNRDNKGLAGLGKYYSTLAPASFANQAAGELFLGEYNYDSNGESRIDGITFSSRPSALSFQYRYVPKGSDTDEGSALIEVLGDGDKVLVSSTITLRAADSMTETKMSLGEYGFGDKAKKIKIWFKSSTSSNPPVLVPTGDALKDIGNAGSPNVTIAANAYKALATGSVLTIDNVQLHYDK